MSFIRLLLPLRPIQHHRPHSRKFPLAQRLRLSRRHPQNRPRLRQSSLKLNIHTEGEFPTEQYLLSIVHSGPPVYGTAGIGRPTLSSGSQHFINVVDGIAGNSLLHYSA